MYRANSYLTSAMSPKIFKGTLTIVVFLFFVCAGHSNNVNITLHLTNASTSCNSSFLLGDYIHLIGIINFTQFEDEAHVHLCVLKGKEDTQMTCIIPRLLKTCKVINMTEQMTCQLHANHIEVAMNLTALSNFSNSLLQLRVNDGERRYNSNTIRIPVIHDPKKVTMTVDDTPVNNNFTEVHVSENLKNSKVCCLDSHKYCIAVVSSNNSSLSNGSNCLSYEPQKNQTEKVYIGYTFCNKKFIDLYPIQFIPDKNATTTKVQNSDLSIGEIVGIVIGLLILIALIVIVLCICFRRLCCRRCQGYELPHAERHNENKDL